MARQVLTKRQLEAKCRKAEEIVEDLQYNGCPSFFFAQMSDRLVYAGNEAIKQHIRHYLEEITNNSDYHPPSESAINDEEILLDKITQLRSGYPLEAEMKMMEMREFVVNLMRIMYPRVHKKLYSPENSPSWFPVNLVWKNMKLFCHDELRQILSSCYEHLGMTIQVYPIDSSVKIRKISKQLHTLRAQTTQTSPQHSPDISMQSPIPERVVPVSPGEPTFARERIREISEWIPRQSAVSHHTSPQDTSPPSVAGLFRFQQTHPIQK